MNISNEITELQFDYGWKNGTFNLVKAVIFDLYNPESINTKAVTLHAKTSFIKDKLDENSRLDFILSKPQKKSVFKEYDKALKILDSIECNSTLVLEEDLQEYSRKTAIELK